jgi:hypothetical protein
MGSREWGKGGAVFRQSLYDFPLTVSLGEKMPSWGLSRWGGGGLIGLRYSAIVLLNTIVFLKGRRKQM